MADHLDRFIELLVVLGSESPAPNDPFDLQVTERHEARQRAALQTIGRQLQGDPRVWSFCEQFDRATPPAETLAEGLQRAARLARKWLPVMRQLHHQEQSFSEREKYQRRAAELDPFLDGARLTTGAFGTLPEPEPEVKPNE